MAEYEALRNQLGTAPAGSRPLDDIQREVLAWLREEAGFAQVFSVNRAGFPVGRTMGAPVDDDFTVRLVQRNVHKRLGQWRQNPKAEVMWVGSPKPGSRNDNPHVYDFDLLAPRVVFIRGEAEFMDEGWLIETFERQSALHRARGWTKAPQRDRENIVSQLVGVRIRPSRVRVEGFGDGPESFAWTVNS
jgi:hypothetical protein